MKYLTVEDCRMIHHDYQELMEIVSQAIEVLREHGLQAMADDLNDTRWYFNKRFMLFLMDAVGAAGALSQEVEHE